MNYLTRILLIISLPVSLLFISCEIDQSGSREGILFLPDANNDGLNLPENFGAVVVVEQLGRGRHLVVRDNGDIYVHLRRLNHEDKGIVALRDINADGRADEIRSYSKVPGTGIEIHNNFLYYSDQTAVYRSPLSEDQLLPGDQIDTIAHLVEGGGHMEKPFTFDNQGNLYVNVGSWSNACQEEKRTKGSPGIDPCTELEYRAGIWQFSDNELHQKQEEAHRYATGIRNAVALSWDFSVNSLFALQHGRDDLHRFWPDLFTEEQNVELPAEEFYQVSDGDDFGWPYCYYDQFEEKRFLNPEYGGDGVITDRCEGVKLPLIGFPGHWGPNDLVFYQGDMFPERYKGGAFIAFHGSWNRLNSDQAGFNVIFVPMKDGIPSGEWEVFADGFVGSKPVQNPGDAKFRPCGLAEGPDGSLYIVDSQKGRIWRIVYYKDGIPGYQERLIIDSDDEESIEVEIPEELLAGKKVYDAYCGACHMANGKGVPSMNPPLIATEYVLGDKDRLIGIVLNGMQDPIEINGETYQNIMASHAFLSDQQIADVLTYVRQSFGNNAGSVTVEEVTNRRARN